MSGHGLLACEDTRFVDWGVAASLSYDPNLALDRGPSLPRAWGGSAARAPPCCGRGPAGPFLLPTSPPGPNSRLTAEVAYGLPLGAHGERHPYLDWRSPTATGITASATASASPAPAAASSPSAPNAPATKGPPGSAPQDTRTLQGPPLVASLPVRPPRTGVACPRAGG